MAIFVAVQNDGNEEEDEEDTSPNQRVDRGKRRQIGSAVSMVPRRVLGFVRLRVRRSDRISSLNGEEGPPVNRLGLLTVVILPYFQSHYFVGEDIVRYSYRILRSGRSAGAKRITPCGDFGHRPSYSQNTAYLYVLVF